MTSRSADSIVTFKQPFAINAQTVQMPAGEYRLTIEEELMEGLSFPAFHRTSTILEIPAIGTASAMKQYVYIADDLDAALQRDERAIASQQVIACAVRHLAWTPGSRLRYSYLPFLPKGIVLPTSLTCDPSDSAFTTLLSFFGFRVSLLPRT